MYVNCELGEYKGCVVPEFYAADINIEVFSALLLLKQF